MKVRRRRLILGLLAVIGGFIALGGGLAVHELTTRSSTRSAALQPTHSSSEVSPTLSGTSPEATTTPTPDAGALASTPPTAGGTSPQMPGSMTYDAARRAILLVNQDGGSVTTWAWNGSRWMVALHNSPISADVDIAYDPAIGKTVAVDRTKTAAWDGSTWIDLHVTVMPPYSMAGRYVVFDGGRNQLLLLQGDPIQTWALDGTTWKMLNATGPSWRYGAGVAYNPLNAKSPQVWLTGGARAESEPLSETWSWAGHGWTKLVMITAPPAGTAQLVFNAGSKTMIAMSTWKGSSSFWSWSDAGGWAAIASDQIPPAVNDQMVYDDARGEIVLFHGIFPGMGSDQGDSQTWAFIHDKWQRR
jgi:hypothetical protein